MKTIATDELKEKMESGSMAVFDVRGDVDYANGHIPGAKSAPLGSLVFRIADVMNPESPVTVYSNGGNCELAGDAVQRLEKLGMNNVYCYEGGTEEWEKAGNSLVESTMAKDHTRGPVEESRSIVVDRETKYGGAFKGKPSDEGGAGG